MQRLYGSHPRRSFEYQATSDEPRAQDHSPHAGREEIQCYSMKWLCRRGLQAEFLVFQALLREIPTNPRNRLSCYKQMQYCYMSLQRTVVCLSIWMCYLRLQYTAAEVLLNSNAKIVQNFLS